MNIVQPLRPISFNRRRLWSWLNIIWNRVDEARIKEVGCDRACAEWLMRNGAFVRMVGDVKYIEGYNVLVDDKKIKKEHTFIEEIDATDSSINHIGFPYFRGCNHIKKIKFVRCSNIDNKALRELSILKESLEHLEIYSCGNVSDDGLLSLKTLRKLKSLSVHDLPELSESNNSLEMLKLSLPQCEIHQGPEQEHGLEQDNDKNQLTRKA